MFLFRIHQTVAASQSLVNQTVKIKIIINTATSMYCTVFFTLYYRFCSTKSKYLIDNWLNDSPNKCVNRKCILQRTSNIHFKVQKHSISISCMQFLLDRTGRKEDEWNLALFKINEAFLLFISQVIEI